ncbi:MAG: 3-dehydroquinate synthase [Thaumarchaeota archaeon]|nr:3-dehydroquinate synthase [Nitrososphaerota archaeon]
METAAKESVKSLFIDPKKLKSDIRKNFTVYSSSTDSDVVLTDNLKEAETIVSQGKQFAFKLKVRENADIKKAVEASKLGAIAVIVETVDWKIIPLENMVAELHNHKTKLLATASTTSEIQTLFGVLEIGVDGVILKASSTEEVREGAKVFAAQRRLELVTVLVKEIKDLGMGERVCVDTASMLSFGEGLLVGSRSNFMFLIHNESGGSKFTSPRPFRVNAGAVHSYTLLPNGRTKYLSEVESGDEVLVVSKDGSTRSSVVGRSKIERRPLRLVKAEFDGEFGGVLLQNAETIALVGKNGQPIPVTELKVGDEVVALVSRVKGRHFGMAVDEYIVEK